VNPSPDLPTGAKFAPTFEQSRLYFEARLPGQRIGGVRVVGGKLLSLVDTAKVLETGIFNPNKEEAFQTSLEIGDYRG